ncbi:hypothetical protein ANN_04044 [Periplaneta americana]|uniref:Uncharacterized protein n=1 Tax=Periplaneta americana TaxID=6978 RepID=A0ABQ8T926_PERAM|nr:hypothetical protein ANN_04044 [Periplaneta americana]
MLSTVCSRSLTSVSLVPRRINVIKAGNIKEEEWKTHNGKKELARKEKYKDKENGQKNVRIVYTMDLQAVKMAPFVQTSSMYYKTKLAVHNLTMYNLATQEVVCYWFDETESDLVASTVATCVVDTLTKQLKDHLLPVIPYSDGCNYQNRNVVMANALLKLVSNTGVTITQNFFWKKVLRKWNAIPSIVL